jgi:putative transposase
MKEIVELKKLPEYTWLNLSVAQSLQQSIVNMNKAFICLFRLKKGFPRFKSKHNNKQVVGFPQQTKIDFDKSKVSVLKLGWIKSNISRRFEGKIKNSVIERSATGKYFISITVEVPDVYVSKKDIKIETSIGIDTGIKTFATLSNGIEIENPKHLKSSLKRLKVLSRRVSKKVKGSNNRKKAVKRLAVLHEKIANQRLDFLHKTTTAIAKQYDTAVVENLNVSGMLKNRKLAQSISDLGLRKFYSLLEYKMKEKGGNYIKIGRFEPSSKLCTCCIVNKELKLSDRIWTCSECGATHQRDLLAANNILRIGLKELV